MGRINLKKTGRFVLHGFNHLLWPAVCVCCKEAICETQKDLCNDCAQQLLLATGGDFCPGCGVDVSRFAIINGRCPHCQGKEIHFDSIARGGVYMDSLRNMVINFKNGHTELDRVLGFLGKSALEGSAFYNQIDFLVPVPLHWARRLVRGYNQSFILAKRLNHPAAKINTELVRIRKTKQQTIVETVSRRAANVAGAFAVRYGHDFAGHNICLVDDIKTSGATLNECAKTLKEAGAAKVFAVVIAVAGQSWDKT